MRRSIVGVVSLAALAALALAPRPSSSQFAPDDPAARTLLATNLTDAMIHPAKGEDTDFFIRAGGVPNIFFLVDSSGSMERLPPDGPATYGGAAPTMPPGVLLSNPGSALAVTAARTGRTLLGCGLDPATQTNPAFAGSQAILHVQGRKFYPPCGQAQNGALVGAPYAGHPGLVAGGADYAFEMSNLPLLHRLGQHGDLAGEPGRLRPDLLQRGAEQHPGPERAVGEGPRLPRLDPAHERLRADRQRLQPQLREGLDRERAPGDAPGEERPRRIASIDQFCDEQGTVALANGQVPAAVCKTCLKEAGWY